MGGHTLVNAAHHSLARTRRTPKARRASAPNRLAAVGLVTGWVPVTPTSFAWFVLSRSTCPMERVSRSAQKAPLQMATKKLAELVNSELFLFCFVSRFTFKLVNFSM